MFPWFSLKDGRICKASGRTGRSFFLNLNSASLMLSKSKRAYLWYGKLGFFEGNIIQENEFSITNKLSIMIEEEEQAEHFKRGHTETEKRRAQQQTRRSRGRRLHSLNQLKFWRENGNLRPSSPGCHIAVTTKTSAS